MVSSFIKTIFSNPIYVQLNYYKFSVIAEQEDHHELTIGWVEFWVEIWTGKVDNLSENDFILASKIEAIPAMVD